MGISVGLQRKFYGSPGIITAGINTPGFIGQKANYRFAMAFQPGHWTCTDYSAAHPPYFFQKGADS